LPLLQEWRERLAHRFPNVALTVYDSEVGSLTTWQGHDWGIDCVLESPGSETDQIALSLELNHLDSTPMIVGADVCWGHPSGHLEAQLVDEPIPFSDDALERLVAALPTLVSALVTALERAQPPR
jgi:hypothetical protein